MITNQGQHSTNLYPDLSEMHTFEITNHNNGEDINSNCEQHTSLRLNPSCPTEPTEHNSFEGNYSTPSFTSNTTGSQSPHSCDAFREDAFMDDGLFEPPIDYTTDTEACLTDNRNRGQDKEQQNNHSVNLDNDTHNDTVINNLDISINNVKTKLSFAKDLHVHNNSAPRGKLSNRNTDDNKNFKTSHQNVTQLNGDITAPTGATTPYKDIEPNKINLYKLNKFISSQLTNLDKDRHETEPIDNGQDTEADYLAWISWRKQVNTQLASSILLRDKSEATAGSADQMSYASRENIFRQASSHKKTRLPENTYIMYGIPRVGVHV